MESGNKYDFDPMSNVAYRTFLIRGTKNKRALRALTISLVALFSLAALFAVIAVGKKE